MTTRRNEWFAVVNVTTADGWGAYIGDDGLPTMFNKDGKLLKLYYADLFPEKQRSWAIDQKMIEYVFAHYGTFKLRTISAEIVTQAGFTYSDYIWPKRVLDRKCKLKR